MPYTPERKLFSAAQDAKGRSSHTEITTLRLFLFANGVGILSIGIETHDLPARSVQKLNLIETTGA